jgi:hypothetical protein
VQPMAWRRAGPVLACTCPSRRPGSPCTFGRLHARAHLGAWTRRVHLGAEMGVYNPPTTSAVPGERRAELAPFRVERRAGRAPFRAGLESSRPPLGRLHLESSRLRDCISSRPRARTSDVQIASRVVPVLAPRTCSHVGMTCTLHTTIPIGLVAVRQPLPSDWLRFGNLSDRIGCGSSTSPIVIQSSARGGRPLTSAYSMHVLISSPGLTLPQVRVWLWESVSFRCAWCGY